MKIVSLLGSPRSASISSAIARRFLKTAAELGAEARSFELNRLSSKRLVFVQTQGNPDEAAFADIFPRYEMFLKWEGFGDAKLIRACGVGPGSIDEAPEAVLRLAEETARQLLA